MKRFVQYENNDGSLHAVASVEAADVPGIIERSGLHRPVELKVHDITTPEGVLEAADDIAVAQTVWMTQIGPKIGRSLTFEAIGWYREQTRTNYTKELQRNKNMGQAIIILTAPTIEATDAILPGVVDFDRLVEFRNYWPLKRK